MHGVSLLSCRSDWSVCMFESTCSVLLMIIFFIGQYADHKEIKFTQHQ